MASSMRGYQVRLILLAVVIVLASVRYPAMRWFVGISLLMGLVLFPLVRWWNSRPVKHVDDQIRLNLDDHSKSGTPTQPR